MHFGAGGARNQQDLRERLPSVPGRRTDLGGRTAVRVPSRCGPGWDRVREPLTSRRLGQPPTPARPMTALGLSSSQRGPEIGASRGHTATLAERSRSVRSTPPCQSGRHVLVHLRSPSFRPIARAVGRPPSYAAPGAVCVRRRCNAWPTFSAGPGGAARL